MTEGSVSGVNPAATTPQQKKVLHCEYIRNVCTSPLLRASSATGIIFLVAIQHFDLSAAEKSTLASASGYGMIAVLFVVPLLQRSGLSIGKILALLYSISGLAALVTAWTADPTLFIAGAMCSVIAVLLSMPLITSLWKEQFSVDQRGRLFARGTMLFMISGFLCSGLVTFLVAEYGIAIYPWVLSTFSLCMLVAAIYALSLPAQKMLTRSSNPFTLLSILWKDKLFGYISMTWMFLGLGNLACLPLRMEYVISQGHGAAYILFVCDVLPPFMAIFSALIWGRLFDRMNFIILRLCINVFFVLSILLFFSPYMGMQIMASCFFGIALGGGTIAWSLWVTKFSPPDQIADYQSVHSFLTGTRSIFGPMLAYAVWTQTDISMIHISYVCAALVIFSCILLLPVIRFGCRAEA